MGSRTSIIVVLAVVLALASTRQAHADEKLAAEFLRKNPGVLKDFDPVADALKAEGLKGKDLQQQAARIKAGMGEHGRPADAARHAQRGKRARFAQTPTEKKLQRITRAARRNAYYAQMDAAGMAALWSWNAQSNADFARIVPHY